MRAEIISIGTELLLGDIVNTNSQYIAQRLAEMGIGLYYQTTVGDNNERLKDALEVAFSRSNIVITTGGLGPTKDDLSKEIAAEYFGKEMVLDEEALQQIKGFFHKINRKMPEANVKQAYFPEHSKILYNEHGTAPGCIIQENDKILILLPGPPKEMKAMFGKSVIPYLQPFGDGIIESKVLNISGLGESQMEEMIQDLIQQQSNPTIAPYANEGNVTIRITAKGRTKDETEKLLIPVEEKIKARLGTYIYGTNNESLEESVVSLLKSKDMTIALAESCTGGLLTGKLVNCSGVSSVFLESAITYSNESKIKRLGVKEETLEKFGAVSAETAMEMAQGIAKTAGTNIGLSVTGVAGPEGGTKEKPVGLVYIGLYMDGKVKSAKLMLWGGRQKIRHFTTLQALGWLRKEVMNHLA
ncbi:competence/damage-inducible protein A [Serpentinicella sp. ANB-PHB4]|uniref:competence/damage-inducible protein A n=1 Tax=Serpentinicella sp. ANB-PHB4 TaxID=3074076 RepID=UPI002866233D|nr:competence/damage-inducible protein A [Serpentinicella sp. ANB-PHB4]MDR5659441.1 competence/damage-inducible protein A [Serpentinicella sp. ANB-PHB4]